MNTMISRNLVLSSKKFEKEKAYWMEKLGGKFSISSFSSDFVGGKVDKTRKKCNEFHFPDDVYKSLIAITNHSVYGIFIILLTGLNYLLSRYSNNEDIIIGSPVFKQDEAGEYLNRVLALRCSIRGEMAFKDLLYQVKNTVEEANENMNYPIEKILELLNFPFNNPGSSCPLFDTMAVFGNIHEENGISDQPGNVVFWFNKAGASLECRIHYNSVLYSKGFVKRLGGHLINYCRVVTRNPLLKLSEIEILTPGEKEQLLIEFNDTTAGYPREKTIAMLLEDQVGKTPDAAAVVFDNRMLTYRELNERSNRWAQKLEQEYSIVHGQIVGLYLQRSLEMVIAVMAILKAKAVCMPVNPPCPKERLRGMCTDSGASVLLQSEGLDCRGWFDDRVEVVNFQQPGKGKYRETASTGKNTGYCRPRDPAWLIYTSGSTGKPKGVMLNHGGIVNHAYTKISEVGARQHDIFCHSLSISFVASIWQFFSPLFIGALLRIYPGEIICDPYELFKQAHNHNVTLLEVVPSLLNAYLKLLESRTPHIHLKAIKWLILTGEAVLPSLVNQWVKKYSIKLINAYGQSECSDDTLHYQIPSQAETTVIPIGKPSNNTRVYVLGTEGELQPVGALGELYISGEGLALGYLNRPELTAEKFAANPFRQNERMFRTGDFACWRPDGNIEFRGRIDHQVQIRGFRVELGEIESHLLNHSEIKEAVVTYAENQGEDKYLCSYIVSKNQIPVSELRKYLLEHIPEYMVPSYFIFPDRIPLTSSGKVDRKALPHPRQAMAAREAYTAPRDQVEKKLVELWGEILDIGEEKIGLNSNFFDMEGHSLNAAILLSRIHKELDAVVPLVVFFQGPTIRELSAYIKKVVKEEYAPVKIVEKQEYYDLSHAQKRLWIADQFEGASNAYNIHRAYILTGDLDAAGFERTFEVLVERHECLRTTFFILGGEPKQKINDMDSTGFKLKYIDLKNEENPGKKQHEWATGEAATVFDLEKGPLLRATLLHLESDKYVFLFTIHHIIADGWSINVIINEISTLYEALIRGENPRKLLLPLKIQYKDYTSWQNNRLKGNKMAKHREYWINMFKNNIPSLEFPMDYARPALRTYNGNHIDFVLEKEMVDRMRKLGQANDASLFMLLLSLVHALLYKYTGQEDIITGSPAAGREHSNLENQVGIYVNILALRLRFKEDDTFKKLLARAKEVSLAAFQHQAYPFDLLVKELKIKHDPARNSLFDIMVALQNTAVPLNNPHAAGKHMNRDNIRLSMFKTEFKISSFEICFNFIEKGDELILELIYNSDIFEEISIAVMGQKFLELTGKVCNNSDIRLKDIELDDFITPPKIDKWEINI